MANGKCCFCIDLRTGCLIIGYINLIGAIIMNLLMLVILATTVVIAQSNSNYSYFHGSEFQKYYEESKRIAVIMATVIAAILVFLIHFLGFTIVLLVGLHKYKRGHVKAYLIYAPIIIVLFIIQFFASFAGPRINAGSIAMDLIFIFLSIYFLLVIRCYYLKMDDPASANNPAIYNTA